MDQTTNVAAFYDALASDYDVMTGFARRFVQEGPHFRHLVARFGITAAVDAGAGTGFHSLLLTQLGVAVTAIDLSEVMLQRLSTHAAEYNLPVTTVQSSFEDLPAHVDGSVDAVFCMGNGLAHLVRQEDLLRALEAFRTVLHPGGVLIAQMLNYERIMRSRKRLQSVREADNRRILRYYTYGDATLRFNVLICPKQGGRTVYSTSLRPLQRGELMPALTRAGYVNVHFYGGITLEPFAPDSSQDLLVIAEAGPGGAK